MSRWSDDGSFKLECDRKNSEYFPGKSTEL